MDTVKARCKRLDSQFPSEVNRHEDSMCCYNRICTLWADTDWHQAIHRSPSSKQKTHPRVAGP
jgi:hypothetical protein